MKLTVLLLFSLCVLLLPVQAQTISSSSGTASMLLLRSDLSPRAAALSGAFTAIADDETAIQYNPAGLVNSKTSSFGLSYASWYQNVRLSNLLLTYKFSYNLGWALSVGHMGMPDIQGKDFQGNPTSRLQVSTTFIHLGMGYRVARSFYLGLGVKYFKDQLAGYGADGFAFDLGGYLDTGLRGLSVGFSTQNLSTSYTYDTIKENLPLVLRTGIAYRPPALKSIIIDLDMVKSSDLDWHALLGMEMSYRHLITIRAGNRFFAQDLFKPTIGFGLNVNGRYLLDYSFSMHEELGMTHRIGVTFRLPAPNLFPVKKQMDVSLPKMKLRPPKWVKFQLKADEIDLNWEAVPGVQYNLYVKQVGGKHWKKVNRHPLFSNTHRIQRMKRLKRFLLAVRSVQDGKESVLSKEVTIEIK